MPRVKRCPKHSRRKPRKTGRCVYYNPPYQKKYERCKNGTRDDGSGRPFPVNCVNYTTTDHVKKWTRCKKGTRKNKTTGKCEPFRNTKNVSYNSKTASALNVDDKDVLIQKLNKEREKLKDMIKKSKPKSLSKPRPEAEDSLDLFLKGIKSGPKKKKIESLSSSKEKSKSKSKSKSSMKLIEDKKPSMNSREKKIVKKVTKKWKSYKKPLKQTKKKSLSEPSPEKSSPSSSSSSSPSLNSEELDNDPYFRKHRANFFDEAIKKFPGKSDSFIEKKLKELYNNGEW